jgi:hypothetical protein
MRDTNRQPNWLVWLKIPKVKVWQAVALSLDIDPQKVRVSSTGWMAGGGGFFHEENQDFSDRLLVLRNNLGQESGLPLLSISMGDPDRCEIAVADFVKWALKSEWPIPPQLSASVASPTGNGDRFEFDPQDETYPIELDIALQAWRYASNNTKSGKLPKQLVDEFIAKNYKDVSKEARERIAVVCNWAKKGGAPTRK